MRIVPVPCLRDNYAYLVICEATGDAAVVDPSEHEPVLAAIEAESVTLRAIWNTHHHWDHTGGNKGLLEVYPELTVVAHKSDKERVPGQTEFVDEGDTVQVGEEVRVQIIYNPGHTRGAISYYDADHAAVFTGDTLFTAGCGRLFEGTAAQMHASLTKLAALPENTRVYCGHEYTAANLQFAIAVEPGSEEVRARAEEVEEMRERDEPTVPSTIAVERATNPFLRVEVPGVIAAARANEPPEDHSPVEVLAAIRRWKDRF